MLMLADGLALELFLLLAFVVIVEVVIATQL